MFTSEEIRRVSFEKSVRGYKPEDVDDFIESVANDFESLEKDKKDLEEKLYVLAEKVEQYKADEESIKVTLINAQRLGESIISDAKDKAETILREATIKKNNIISSAYAEIEGSEDAVRKLRKEVSDFKHTVLSLYTEHIESLSKLPDDKSEEQPAKSDEVSRDTKEFRAVNEKIDRQESQEASERPTSELEQASEPETEEVSAKFKNISSLFEE